MKRDIVRQWVNVVALVIVIVVNGLANALPINAQTTGEISDRFEIFFVPAGYVFSIWGLIYLALIGFVVYQALPSQRENPRLRRVGYLFALSCAANVAWIFLWHYERFPLTLVAMGVLLVSLIGIYLRLGIGRTPVSPAEKWLVRVPFSLYLGWITVATIANVTQVLDYLNWGAWGVSAEAWTVIMLAAATGITGAVLFTRGDVAYALVIVWAVVGIAVEHAAAPVVVTAAWAAAGAVVLLIVVKLWLGRRPQAPSQLAI